jgi:alpha-1,3-rhamnosyl/mannosyltransferase
VAIDARQLWELGIGTYVRNLVGGLARASGADLELTLLLPRRPGRDAWYDPAAAEAGIPGAVASDGSAPVHSGSLPSAPLPSAMPLSAPLRVRVIGVRAGKQSAAEQLEVPFRLLGQRLDLVHVPHYVAPLAVPHPLVVTVHDVIHLLFPELLSPFRRRMAGRMLALALRRARRVIVPSRRTADDLAQLFPFASRKLRVTGSGLAARFMTVPSQEAVEAWRAVRKLPRRYGVAVGAIRPHKNLVRLARAYAGSGLAPDVGLLVAGETPPRYAALEDEIAASGGPGLQLIGWIPDRELPLLYAGADFVAVPSLYEGFGLSALEGMASGVPVVAADAGSLPELVGDAGLLISPHDLSGWTAALIRVARDAGLRAELGARGQERARAHRLEQLGADTLAVYREAAACAGS